jgi:uncharacterized protein DUF2330
VRSLGWLGGASGVVSFLLARQALACGGLFCDQASVVVPPAQSSERIVFVMNPDGWTHDPEAMVARSALAREPSEPATGGPSVDAYIEISYSGAAASFAWLVPLLSRPVLIGTASPEIFADLDQATAPRFTFTYATGSRSMSGGGCGGAPVAAAAGDDDDGDGQTVEEPAVTVMASGRVGPYEVAVLDAETAADLRAWLVDHDYQLPAMAEPILERYLDEGKSFAAFRLADGQGVGSIQPVVIRTPGTEPCIPLRLTPVASEPVLSVTAIIMAEGVARPGNFNDADLDEQAVRPTSPFTSDYQTRLRQSVQDLGGLALQTEFAGPPGELEVTSATSAALVARAGFVTRLTTRIAPSEMTTDPIFLATSDRVPISREHVIDVTNDPVALRALGVDGSVGTRSSDGGGPDCRAAGRVGSSWALLVLAPMVLWHRRRRRA